MSLPSLPTGYYHVTEDVPNPRPDRRIKRTAYKQVWKKGSRVFLQAEQHHADGSVATRATITFDDGSHVLFGEPLQGTTAFPEFTQGNGLLGVLEPAKRTVGQVLAHSYATPAEVVARAVDLGKLTLEDIKAIDAELSDWSENLVEEFDRVHEIENLP